MNTRNDKVETSMWCDGTILNSLKILLITNPRDPNRREIQVRYAQTKFFDAFGYSPADLPMPLSALYSNAQERKTVISLENAIRAGKPKSHFINLCDKTNKIISCFISVSGGVCGRRQINPSAGDMYTVLTIRSASIIGNMTVIDMMLCEAEYLNKDRLNARIGCAVKEEQSPGQEPVVDAC